MTKAALQAGGYEAVCHASAESGLQAAAESKFNAVVLDLVMPEIDGFEFLTRFRELSTCKETPVVVWTSKDITAHDLKRLKNSAQSIAVKSGFSIEAVLQELHRYVGPTGESEKSPRRRHANFSRKKSRSTRRLLRLTCSHGAKVP